MAALDVKAFSPAAVAWSWNCKRVWSFKGCPTLHKNFCIISSHKSGTVYIAVLTSDALHCVSKMNLKNEISVCLHCLSVCLSDLPVKGTRQTSTRGYKHQASYSQSLSYRHWFSVFEYELHNSRSCDSVTRRQPDYSHCEISGQLGRIWTHNLIIASLAVWPSCLDHRVLTPSNKTSFEHILWGVFREDLDSADIHVPGLHSHPHHCGQGQVVKQCCYKCTSTFRTLSTKLGNTE